VVEVVNRVVERLCQAQGVSPSRVAEMVVVGNTAMHHLFLRLPVEQLGVAPYVPAISAALDVKARDLGLRLAPGAWVHTLPNVAGFVGADHVAMVLASELDSVKGIALGLDIGTNTEVVLVREGEMASCSCASGPAFEGGHILHGMRAATGAIERVNLVDGKLSVATIGDAPAVGICGSGILDAVAVLYRAGAINFRGRMESSHPWVRQGERGREVVLAEAATSGTGEDIVIVQEDINQIQLAKGAIRTGIDTLLKVMEVEEGAVERVVIAGAFGSYIRTDSALAIGMFPAFPRARFEQVGNAAGVGAKLALVSRKERARAQEIASRIRHVELMSQPDFMESFALAMYLPR
ncbi:MAG: ASKHA domain-containing protein, partial [Chloroflexota bacterium]|nr:ASKHA domain-containing protein [Chloroflexota bacterium]